MQRLTRGLMVVLGIVSLLSLTGCDVTQQVLDTIGLAGDITSIWVN